MTQDLTFKTSDSATDWYYIDNIYDLDTPALAVYPDRVKKNIKAIKNMLGGDISRLRPHVKTYKNKEVTRLMLNAGITKFKCATIAEAEMLALCEAPDVLLAYQATGPKLKRFIQLISSYQKTKFSCLIDNPGSAREISEAAIQNGHEISVYIDLDIGQHRTGVEPEKALQLYKECELLPKLKPIGLHAYDGHLHDADVEMLAKKCEAGFEAVTKLKAEIIKSGFPEPVVIAGGSPTFPVHAKRAEVECSPGTFIYWDGGYQIIAKEQPFIPAALVISRVISLPSETKICLDLGHKSVSAENELSKRVYFLNAPGLQLISQSEEHLVADAGKGHKYQVGDILYGLPYHICPTVALYEQAITIDSHKTSGEWKNIARDRKINI